jgi:RES domain-containing protein
VPPPHADNPEAESLLPPLAGIEAMDDPPLPIPPSLPPHPDSDRLARGIRRCLPLATSLTGIIYRAASVRRANPADLIAGIGSQLTGGRWTPPGAFRAVYASRDEATALDEARQQNLRQGVPPWMALPLVLTALEVDLRPALDLTDGRVRRALRISRERMLAEPWWLLQDRGREALTQALGRLARDHGFVALLVPSAARLQGTNVVVYPDRITAGGRLAVVNPERLPPGPA